MIQTSESVWCRFWERIFMKFTTISYTATEASSSPNFFYPSSFSPLPIHISIKEFSVLPSFPIPFKIAQRKRIWDPNPVLDLLLGALQMEVAQRFILVQIDSWSRSLQLDLSMILTVQSLEVPVEVVALETLRWEWKMTVTIEFWREKLEKSVLVLKVIFEFCHSIACNLVDR